MLRPRALLFASIAGAALLGCTPYIDPSYDDYGGGGGGGLPTSCSLDACTRDPACLATADNSGKTRFGLRISQLVPTTPAPIATGLFATVLSYAFLPDAPDCFSNGDEATSWLLVFDTETNTVTFGGAEPCVSSSAEACHLDGVLTTPPSLDGNPPMEFDLSPVTFDLTKDGALLSIEGSADVNLPLRFDPDAPAPTVLPFRSLKIGDVTLTDDQSCIGRFRSALLDPAQFCAPTVPSTPLFSSGGVLEGIITLEDADRIESEDLGHTLCALLSGDADQYSIDVGGMVRCRRTDGVIDFKGDTCAATGAPADASCADAVTLRAHFAASAVPIP